MARCGCENTCNCVVIAGAGVQIIGTGGLQDPYVVSTSASEANWLYRTTDTVQLQRVGQGTPTIPYEVIANARLDSDGGLTSTTDGIAVKIDPIAGNTLVAGASGLRVDAAAGVGIDPDGGIILGPDGLAIEVDPIAGNALVVDASGARVIVDTASITTRMNLLLQMQRQNFMMSGGGLKRASPSRITWADSFYLHGPRLTAVQAGQFYQITMPPNGTVITGVGGAANATIAATGNYAGLIPLGDWQSLWYLVPTTSTTTTSVAANFRIATYTASFQMPDNAVLVAWRYGGNDKTVYWGDGSSSVPWLLGANTLKEGAAATTGLGTGGVQALWYRNTQDQHLEVSFYVLWGTSGNSPGGDLYWDLPMSIPALDAARVNWDAVGVGKFFTSAAAGKAAMDWPMTPWIGAGTGRIFFLVPTGGNDVRFARMRVHDGSFAQATSRPIVTEGYISTQGSILQGQMSIPLAGLIT